MKKVTKVQIEKFLKEELSTNRAWALRALVRIYDFQTADEKISGDTYYINNVGFTGADGEFLTSLAKQWKEKNFLTVKQMAFVYKKMPKYWNQIWSISDQGKIINIIESKVTEV
jgi:hypothetical protein